MTFRILYRQFLFRMVDLEVLSAHGDVSRLAGQIVALLGALSFTLSLSSLRFALSTAPPEVLRLAALPVQHLLIALTMMVAGLLAVLTWDSTFPDRRDVFVLAPLPLSARTLFFAKAAAIASALGLAVLAANAFTGIAFPPFFMAEAGPWWALPRTVVAYWLTMAAGAAFLYSSLLSLQGASCLLLPRRVFLRWSAFAQLASFCLILAVFFLEPPLATPTRLAAPESQVYLRWLPTYWFFGLFHYLNGDAIAEMTPLARRAAMGFAGSFGTAALVFTLSYFRTIQRIVEEPDITPGTRRRPWRLPLGRSLTAAVTEFALRTLLRSRQHRVVFAGYLGVGLAVFLVYLKFLIYGRAADPWWRVNTQLLASSAMLMYFAVAGLRVLFTLPLSLGANWIFGVTAIRPPRDYYRATRWALFAIAVAPFLLLAAAALYPIWPAAKVTGHLMLLALAGSIAADVALHGFRKVPFTCAYLPGKSNLHVMGLTAVLALIGLTNSLAAAEKRALADAGRFARFLAFAAVAAGAAHYRWCRRTLCDEPLQFDDVPPSELTTIELRRDGVLVDTSQAAS